MSNNAMIRTALQSLANAWQQGERLTAREVLTRYPELADDHEAVLDLIDAEKQLREGVGETPTLDEYIRDFPWLAESLSVQFGLYEVFASGSQENTPAQAGNAEPGEPVTPAVPEQMTTAFTGPLQSDSTLPVVPGYVVVARINQGGMGVVYRARNLALDREVALKMIRPGQLGTEQAQLRFQEEARLMARLDHPNIVPIHEVGQHEGQVYFTMKLVEGGTLADHLQSLSQDCLTELETREGLLRLFVLMARAVEFAHSQGILHRDLKPANILLALNGNALVPLVTDFGLARQIDPQGGQTQTHAIIGTPFYMAPEQTRPGMLHTPATDVWSLGAILYELLVGRPPFRGISAMDILKAVQEYDPEPPRRIVPGISRDLETIVLKCLEKEPNRRYLGAGLVADEVERVLENQPIHARPVSRGERVIKWVRRNRLVAMLSASVGLLLLGAAIGSVVFSLVLMARNDELTFALGEKDRAQGEAETNALQARTEANRAQSETLTRLTESAGAALQRGQLDVAEKQLDRAIEIAPAEKKHPLEVLRLRSLTAATRHGRLIQELGRLDKMKLGPRERAMVVLFQGDVDLWELDPARATRGRSRLLEALAMQDELGKPALSKADAAYARGVLAAGPNQAIPLFEEAVRAEPFHLRANSALLVEYALTGWFEKARSQASLMQRAYPAEPVVPLILAMIAALQNDRPALEKQHEELKVVVPADRLPGIQATLRTFEQSARMAKAIDGGFADQLKVAVGAVQNALMVPVLRGRGVPEVVGVGLPVLERTRRLHQVITQIDKALQEDRLDEADALLAQSLKESPEAMLWGLKLAVHSKRGQIARAKGDIPTIRRLASLAYDAATAGEQAPTMMPCGPYRRRCAWVCLAMEAAWENDWAKTQADIVLAGSLFRPPLQVITAVGAAQKHTERLPRRKDNRFFHQMMQPWPWTDTGRSELLPMVLDYGDVMESRLLLRAWHRDEPHNIQVYKQAVRLELRLGNRGAAIDWAEKGMATNTNPWDLRFLWLLRETQRAAGPGQTQR